jgi:hypothetical protein
MAFDGSGNFNRVYSWASDAANNINITASRVDTEDNGFASGLTLCVTRDGQGKMGADFLPAVASTYNVGNAGVPWLAGYFGSLTVNGIAVYGGAPINTQAGTTYTLAVADSGKAVLGTNAAAKTFTIPANVTIPIPPSSLITLVNGGAGAMSIAITTDTLTLAGTTSTGTRSLVQNGIATLLKLTATTWLISGVGLS